MGGESGPGTALLPVALAFVSGATLGFLAYKANTEEGKAAADQAVDASPVPPRPPLPPLPSDRAADDHGPLRRISSALRTSSGNPAPRGKRKLTFRASTDSFSNEGDLSDVHSFDNDELPSPIHSSENYEITSPSHASQYTALARQLSVVGKHNRKLTEVSSLIIAPTVLRLTKLLFDELDTTVLLKKIMDLCRKPLEADRCSIFLVCHEKKELWSTVAHGIEMGTEIRMPMDKGLAGHVATTGTIINIKDAYQDERFDPTTDQKTGYLTKSILVVPMKDNSGVVTGVFQVINKGGRDSKMVFNEQDLELAKAISIQCAIALRNSQLYHNAQAEKARTSAILTMLRSARTFDSDVTHEQVVAKIESLVSTTADILNVENSTLFLLDQLNNQLYCQVGRHIKGYTIEVGAGVVGQAAVTGETVIVNDETEGIFDREFDECMQITTRNFLVCPVKRNDTVIAVFQVTNRKWPTRFTTEDIEILQAVALEIAAIIDKRSLEAAFYSNFAESQDDDSSNLENERRAMVASFMSEYTNRSFSTRGRNRTRSTCPMMNPLGDVLDEMNSTMLSSEQKDEINSYGFDPFVQSPETLRSVIVHIYSSLGLLQGFSISKQTLLNFICAIENLYIPNPYHNWYHGFSVCHITYLLFSKTSVDGCLSSLDIFALIIATMCHDVGHDGKNNDFHIKTSSNLAIRYNDVSVLENMHAATAFEAMNKPDCNILGGGIPGKDLVKLRKRIISNILATDMAHHMDLVSQINESLTDKEAFNKGDEETRNLLSQAICHSADLSNPVLPFNLSLKWANFIVEEFNTQADEERALGLEVAPHMQAKKGTPDHARTNLGFLDYVVFPLWKCMNEFLGGELEECIQNLQSNRVEWARRVSATNPDTN